MIDTEILKHTYSDGISNKTILIIGNPPPPIGGVSVHVQRVKKKLENQYNRVFLFDPTIRGNKLSYTCRLIKALYTIKPHILYYHTIDLNSSLIEFRLLVSLKKLIGYELVVVEHNCRHLYARNKKYLKLFNRLIQRINKLVLIGHTTWESYLDTNITLPLHTSIEAAFLPPDILQESEIFATYPISIHDFFKAHSPIITFNAFKLIMHNNQDLYGIDLCIDALQKFKEKYPTVGLVCVLNTIGNTEYFTYLQNKIAHYNLQDHVYFLLEQKELWPLLKKSDLFVRPTRSDAESVSVQEALHFGIPVVASDAATRPPTVITFRSGNAVDLYNKLILALHKDMHETHNKQHNYLHPQ